MSPASEMILGTVLVAVGLAMVVGPAPLIVLGLILVLLNAIG